jgi:hypothetical protein
MPKSTKGAARKKPAGSQAKDKDSSQQDRDPVKRAEETRHVPNQQGAIK